MKKRLLALLLLSLLLAGCAKTPAEASPAIETPAPTASAAPAAEPTPTAVPLLEENIPEDNCRNWYEVFVYSYKDSDGDGIGDLNGLREKLSYIRELGFTGIWLMPIMPSPSYHKYDVTDYYSIDPQYGTLEDYKALLEEAHALGIKVIIDLPVNHTSSEHPWFVSAEASADSPYRDYYNFTEKSRSGYSPCKDGYYEARFVSTMPDLNLDSEQVRREIVSIMDFWLSLGTDGFRLDAVTSYYTGAQNKNIAFLSWLNEEAKAISPHCYIVGEAWTDIVAIAAYYESGIDSFFLFPMADSTGYVTKILNLNADNRGELYTERTLTVEKTLGADVLPAPFMGNHDMGRITGVLTVRNMSRLKAATGILALMKGGLFYYYGDEIGMVGAGNDPNKRIGMLWTTENETTSPPPGADSVKYVLPSVEEQEQDPGSLLNYVRSAMNLRNAFPAIARGTSAALASPDPMVSLLLREYNGEKLVLALNLCDTEKSLSLKDSGMEGLKLLGYLDAAGAGIAYEDNFLTLSPWGIAILGY